MPFGKGVSRFVPSLTYQPVNVVRAIVARFEGKEVVDLGAGGRRIAPWVKTVDFVELPGTDYICDFVNGRTPFPDGSVDLAVSTGVLEHVENEISFIAEIGRILKPGGLVHIEVPFLQQYHDDPIDCRRYTQSGLNLFLEQHGFKVVESGVHIGPTVTILTLMSYYLDLLLTGDNVFCKAMGSAAHAVFSVVAWPLRFLDIWLIKKPGAHRLAFGVYSTAEKIQHDDSDK